THALRQAIAHHSEFREHDGAAIRAAHRDANEARSFHPELGRWLHRRHHHSGEPSVAERSRRALSIGAPFRDGPIECRQRLGHTDVQMLQTLGDGPAVACGTPIEPVVAESGGYRFAVPLDSIDLVEHDLELSGHAPNMAFPEALCLS